MAQESNKQGVRDWGIVVVAAVLAFLVWLHAVTEQDDHRREIEIPLVVIDPSTGDDLLVANLVPSHATVIILGSGKQLLFARAEDFLLKVEPKSTRLGKPVSVRLNPELVEVRQPGIRVEEVLDPREISLVLEPRLTRDVAIRPFLQFQVADSYTRVGDLQLEPTMVRVSGPKSHVEALGQVMTDSLVLSLVSEDVEVDLALRPPLESRLTLSHDRVRIRIDIQELAEYDLLNVPVVVRNSNEADVVAEPSRVHVRVRGGADVIGRLDSDNDLNLYVDHASWSLDPGKGAFVQSDSTDSLFEIRQIVPERVNIVRR